MTGTGTPRPKLSAAPNLSNPHFTTLTAMKRAAPDAESFEPAVKRQKSLASFFVTSEKEQKQPAQELIVIEDDDLQIKSDRRTPPLVISSLTTPFPPPDHPSYRLPPSPTFNHPFQIPSIPDNLDLQYNSSSTSLVKPTLGLDLLYLELYHLFYSGSCRKASSPHSSKPRLRPESI